jgi:Dictyostelium (slime mold) repeat
VRSLAALALLVLGPPSATAHFALQSPASWRTQDALGNPQKVGPCGEEDSDPPTGVVTVFAPGETITITLDETIFHPGHYRVALAVNDRSELPDEPPVTPGVTACGSAPVMDPPVFPVLADGALRHTYPFSDTHFIEVTLPKDVTCTRCTLQVLEFMSDHPAPCFYHHCADISIGAGAATCANDGDCADGNLCTSDRCNVEAGTCEHIDTVSATCDDGNACTRDACSPSRGCLTQPIALLDVDARFLGDLRVSACSTEELPSRIDALFRATGTPAKATRLLHRASKRLRKGERKLASLGGRRISAECATALSDVLREAEARVQCLLSG